MKKKTTIIPEHKLDKGMKKYLTKLVAENCCVFCKATEKKRHLGIFKNRMVCDKCRQEFVAIHDLLEGHI